MEHIIQIGVNIDDDAIQKAAVNQAAKEIVEDLKNTLFLDKTYYSDKSLELNSFAKETVREVFDAYRDEIIKQAAELVAGSITRSKKYKELLNGLSIDSLKEKE